MASSSPALHVKIVVEFHEGECSNPTTKMREIFCEAMYIYTKTGLEKEIESLFPHLGMKGCCKLSHSKVVE